VAFISCFTHVPLMIAFVKFGGAGRHLVTVPEKFETWAKLIFVEEFVYILSVTIPKLAILALYMRVFTTKPYQYAVYGIASVMFLNVVVDYILTLVTCKPIAFNWDITIVGGSCGDRMAAYRWISIPNILTDLFMLVLPLPVVWKLQTGNTQKIGLTATFLTGSIGLITSILRFVTFFTVDLFADPTFNVVQTMTWTCAEPGVYFIAACLPSLRPLARMVFEKVNITQALTRAGLMTANTKKSNASSTGNASNIRMSRRKGTANDVEGDRNGFSILKDTDIKVTTEGSDDMDRLVDHRSQQQRRYQQPKRQGGEDSYGWEERAP